MHHTIKIAVSAKAAEGMLVELEQLDGVVNLSVVCGASVKPPGDIVTVHMLNRDVDAVPAVAAQVRQSGPVSGSTAETQAPSTSMPGEQSMTTSMSRAGRSSKVVATTAGSWYVIWRHALPLAAVTWHWPSMGALAICCRRAGHGKPRGASCQRRSQIVTHRGDVAVTVIDSLYAHLCLSSDHDGYIGDYR